MDTIQRTRAILAEAEKALAALASEAAKETKYEAASCLIDSARDVSNLAVRTLHRLGHASENAQANGVAPTAAASLPAPVGRRSRKKVYPRFLRQGDELIKIGWSPSEKAEYEHKSPKKVVLLLAAAIAKAGANGKRFTMDRVMPLQDSTDGKRMPDYQVYVCLAWFRQLGFVKQHGRQGYSLTSKGPLEPMIEPRWAELEVR